MMIVFNADDYGMTKDDVNRILEAIGKGVIRSTTIASNYVTDNQLMSLKGIGDISTGIHLNITEGRALGDHSTITSNGEFFSKKNIVKKILLGKIDEKEVRKEIRFQIERLLDSGVAISHIDTHQNMHFFPQILSLIKVEAEKYNIKRIRGLRSEYFWFSSYSRVRAIIKNTSVKFFCQKYLNDFDHSQRIILNAPGLGYECGSVEDMLNLWSCAIDNYYDPGVFYEVPCHLKLGHLEYELYKDERFIALLNKSRVRVGNFYDYR
jgi:predicted glycoside hydrolase/deacetylase ChbG (UPF0249 family)